MAILAKTVGELQTNLGILDKEITNINIEKTKTLIIAWEKEITSKYKEKLANRWSRKYETTWGKNRSRHKCENENARNIFYTMRKTFLSKNEILKQIKSEIVEKVIRPITILKFLDNVLVKGNKRKAAKHNLWEIIKAKMTPIIRS